MINRILLAVLIAISIFFLINPSSMFSKDKTLENKLNQECPQWMKEQIDKDLAPFKETGISQSELYLKFLTISPDFFIIKFSIINNQVVHEELFNEPGLNYRIEGFCKAFTDLCKTTRLPDATFYLLLHDGLGQPEVFAKELAGFPLFVMSRASLPGYQERSILIPDYENLQENYQVLKNKNLKSYVVPWHKKNPQLIWRGSTAQSAWSKDYTSYISAADMNASNCMLFSRFKLCELSKKFPKLINARYTFLADLDKTFPYVKNLQDKWMPYKDQFQYKYHILLNGNAAAYTCSGWKFFTNSLIFVPHSIWTQWYHGALKPYEHFIPVREDLGDLLEKIEWACAHDKKCENIAKNARIFAVNNLTRSDSLIYIYFLLNKYSSLLIE